MTTLRPAPGAFGHNLRRRLSTAEFTRRFVKFDGKEIDRAVWVTPEKIASYVKRKEYLEIVKNLLEEALHCLEEGRSTK